MPKNLHILARSRIQMDNNKRGRRIEGKLDSSNVMTLRSKTDNRRKHQIPSPACEFFQCDLHNQFLPENLHSERKICTTLFYVSWDLDS